MQTERKYMSEAEKAEMDMCHSAGKNMYRTADRTEEMAAMVGMLSLSWTKV